MLPAIFDAFVKASPVSFMARGVMERFLNPDRLNAWFEEVSDKQYTRDLLFSTLFERHCHVNESEPSKPKGWRFLQLTGTGHLLPCNKGTPSQRSITLRRK